MPGPIEEPVAAPTALLLVQQLRQQLIQRSELLRQSAHDLKRNFGLIRWVSDGLQNGLTQEDQQEMLGMLHRNVQQPTQLIAQLLDVTRLEAGQERRQLTRFKGGEVLSSVVETLQPLAHQHGLWLRSQGPTLLLVEGDLVKLQRIVQNLLLNAIKYTRQGGVMLEWGQDVTSGQWWLTVIDTGFGLAIAGNQPPSGEGIGLLIARQLCALLAGQFRQEEPSEAGTRFRVRFPQPYAVDSLD